MSTEKHSGRFRVRSDEGIEYTVYVYRSVEKKKPTYKTAGGKILQAIDEQRGVFRIFQGPTVWRVE